MLLAVAQTYVVYAGDIDLSAGTIVSLVNVVIVVMMEKMGGDGLTVIAALGVGLLTGLACGIVNGIVVAALRLQAIVATFATIIFFTGLALYVMPVAGTPAPACFWRTYGGRFLDIPFVFYAVVVLAIVLYVLARTRLVDSAACGRRRRAGSLPERAAGDRNPHPGLRAVRRCSPRLPPSASPATRPAATRWSAAR